MLKLLFANAAVDGVVFHARLGSGEQPTEGLHREGRVGAQSEFYRAKDYAKSMRSAWLTHVMPVARYEHIERDDKDRTSELKLVTLGVSLLFSENRSKLPRKDQLRAQYTVEF